ncbi:hypothetical protein FHETE_1263 [Fusarium heterosporum]|uniref:Uncharacterized protein n=1 Tax=Fusarium heterosporum TaxID=42747 RepID=A0A8H5X212_FUSHE|nr:hypothetical protein FHETE_1263 [Fusarium heterosporum]
MATASTLSPAPLNRTDSDISPRTIIPPKDSTCDTEKADYFPDSNTIDGSNTSVRASDGDDSSARKSSISFAPDPRTGRSSSRESNQNQTSNKDCMIQRKSSTGSVSFRRMTNPQLPQGNPQQMSNTRIRASSPNHQSQDGWKHRGGYQDRDCFQRQLQAVTWFQDQDAALQRSILALVGWNRFAWPRPFLATNLGLHH